MSIATARGLATDIAPPLPNNLDAERSILGAILLDNAALAKANVKTDDFFLSQHRRVYEQMVAMAATGTDVDLLTLTDALNRNGSLEAAGGAGYLASLVDGVPRVSNVEHYGNIIKRDALSRAAIHLAARIQSRVFEGDPAEDVFRDAVQAFGEVASGTNGTPARTALAWEECPTESEIIDGQGLELKYAVDKLIPLQRITLFFGPEKSCKSLLALYIAKCVVTGARVLDNFTVQQMPVLYIDAEDGILGEYLGWMQSIGTEQVRFRTLQTGIPALDDPALLQICRDKRPLVIVDSLHKFLGRESDKMNAWRSTDVEPVLEKLRQLAVAGATVILIHHATKSDPEQYRDSGAIGAGVDFLFAVVGEEPVNGIKRVRLVGRPSRGAQPPSLSLIAFPHLVDLGKFTLECDPPKTNVERVVEFVAGVGKATKRAVREGVKGMRDAKKDAALDEAVECGRLVLDSGGGYTVAQVGPHPTQPFIVAQPGHTPDTHDNKIAA